MSHAGPAIKAHAASECQLRDCQPRVSTLGCSAMRRACDPYSLLLALLRSSRSCSRSRAARPRSRSARRRHRHSAPGVDQQPREPSLRFDILKFGLDQFCFQMLAAARRSSWATTSRCSAASSPTAATPRSWTNTARQSFVVQYSGKGYGWTNLTGRIGFTSRGADGVLARLPDVRRRRDVHLLPARKVDATNFQTLMVESAFARGGMAVAGLDPDTAGASRSCTSQLSARVHGDPLQLRAARRTSASASCPRGRSRSSPFQIQNADKLVARQRAHGGAREPAGLHRRRSRSRTTTRRSTSR